MKKTWILFLAFFSLIASATGVYASDHSYIASVPQASISEQVYRVNIQRINGKQPIDTINYRVKPGEVTLRVSLVIEPQNTPKLRIAADEISVQEITITVEPGMSYQIGGKVNPDATDAEQRDGSFWEPVVHSERKT